MIKEIEGEGERQRQRYIDRKYLQREIEFEI
jgi:hypothetical protein